MARTAIIVFHGVGQHQEFDTLEGVAQALLERKPQKGDVTVKLVKFGKTPVAAATVQLGGADVDLYDAYWSPWTKGKASSLAIFSAGSGRSGESSHRTSIGDVISSPG